MVGTLESQRIYLGGYDRNNSTGMQLPFNGTSEEVPISYSNQVAEENIIEYHDTKVRRYMNKIRLIILSDEYEDGEISNSEKFIEKVEQNEIPYVNDALMKLYLENYDNIRILEGILVMVSSVPYEMCEPQGPIMALGLLSHEDLEIRDRAIQCYEKWNSKKGLHVLKSLKCDPSWLQEYVNKVISYIERDGVE